MNGPLPLSESVLLLRPLWLLALIPVLGLAAVLHRLRRAGDWRAHVDPALWAAMRRIGQVSPARPDHRTALPLLAAGIAACALAGPAVLRPGAVQYRALDPMILLLDLSPSVTEGPGLGDLQAAAAFLLAEAKGRPVGIVAYAADAYAASAPTTDAMSLQSLIAVLGPGTMPVTGSRPDIALAQVREMIADPDSTGSHPRGIRSGGSDGESQGGGGLDGADIILISDGDGATGPAFAEARRLREAGARVWALAIERMAPGAPPPDRGALGRLAQAGGGSEAAARSPRMLLDRIEAARRLHLARSEAAAQSVHDLGPLLLLLALPAALSLFRRRL